MCQATHGILPNDERIVNALSIKGAWPKFASFCEEAVGSDGRVGATAAWNGKTDLESFFRLTEYTYKDELFMPKGYKYFIDPMACIKTCAGCELNDNVGLNLATLKNCMSQHLNSLSTPSKSCGHGWTSKTPSMRSCGVEPCNSRSWGVQVKVVGLNLATLENCMSLHLINLPTPSKACHAPLYTCT